MDIKYFKNPFLPTFTCYICGRTNDVAFVHPPTPEATGSDFVSAEPICGKCFRERAEKQGRRLHVPEPDLTKWVREQMFSIGMATEEMSAKLDQIPQQILAQVPDAILQRMASGSLPKEAGLGLAGMAGAGKSSTWAALVHACILTNAQNRNPFAPLVAVKWTLWMNWPTTCHRWRLNGLDWRIEADIKRATWAKLLVLDDLGRETRRRDSSEDVATGHLDAVITERDRQGRVTLWTTNLFDEELIDRYGTSMIRRLCRLNPMVWLGGAGFHPQSL